MTVRTDKSIKLILFRDWGQFRGFSGSFGPSQSTISASSLWVSLSVSGSDGMVALTICCKGRLLSMMLKFLPHPESLKLVCM